MTSKGYNFALKLENGNFIIVDGIAEYDEDFSGTYKPESAVK